jgi:hypothetical protein
MSERSRLSKSERTDRLSSSMPFNRMQLKLLVSSRIITTEILQHETASWILYESSTQTEVSSMKLDPVDLDLLVPIRIANAFVLLFKKVPKRQPEERRWS